MLRFICFILICCIFIASGCSESPTPQSVCDEYQRILSDINPDLPGKSILALVEFTEVNSRYPIAKQAQQKISELKKSLPGQIEKALGYARSNNLDLATRIIADLSLVDPRCNQNYWICELYLADAQSLMKKGETAGLISLLREIQNMKKNSQQEARMNTFFEKAASLQTNKGNRILQFDRNRPKAAPANSATATKFVKRRQSQNPAVKEKPG